MALSTISVAGTDFHRPRPSSGPPPGHSGMSWRWLAKSSTQWLTTRAAAIPAPRGDAPRARTMAPNTIPQTIAIARLCDHGYETNRRGVNARVAGCDLDVLDAREHED